MGDFWEPTAQMFSSLFEKPKMTEKLLTKPPFKYLFDVINETRKATGFGEGLYADDELKSDFYEDKNRKMFFLKKILTLTSAMIGEEVEAKPNKIVAGVEPEKTNEFLQAMYKAAVSGEDSAPFVKKILSKFAKEEEEVLGRPPAGVQPDREEKPKREEVKAEEPKKTKPKEDKPKQEEKPKEKAKQPVEEPKEPERQLQRPSSAKKRPPGGKGGAEVVDEPTKKNAPSGIIIEKQTSKQDDDDFIERRPEGMNMDKIQAQEHGKFVRDALKDANQEQAKKEVEDDAGASKIRMGKLGKKKTVAQTNSNPSGEPSTTATSLSTVTGETGPNEVDACQKLIQALTQSTNPLKRSVDFITDDIESMNKEMEYWRNQYLGSKAKYQTELKNTEEATQPLQNKLAEIEEQIREKKLRIQNAKAQIIQNEQKINNLLYSVVATK